jgi:hypothetical protein
MDRVDDVDMDALGPELRGSLGPVAGLVGPVSRASLVSLERIVEVAAFGFGVDPEVLLGPSRTRPLVHWRQITLAAARQVGYSYPAIADYVGCDHTTVIHAVRRVASQPAWSEAATTIVAWASAAVSDERGPRSSTVARAHEANASSQRGDDELTRRRAAAADAAYPSQGGLGHSWGVEISGGATR